MAFGVLIVFCIAVFCDTIMSMTFRHTLYISLAAHMLIFGSAIAFARYGSGVLRNSSGFIQVSLVSPESSYGAGSSAEPVQSRSVQPPAEQAVKKIQKTSTDHGTAQEGIPPAEASIATQSGNETGETAGAESQQGTGQYGSAGFGLINPEEWAALAAAIERTKNYPRIARERGIEGVVRLRFRLAPSGAVEKIEIVQSSGYEILDTASIGAVYRAAPMPYVGGWVEMPMRYVLK